jgi:hypothetical protein
VLRALSLLVWVALALPALWPLLRSRGGPRAGADTPRDELVKDPVSQTYVVRSRAVRRFARGGTRYFCSVACANRDLSS